MLLSASRPSAHVLLRCLGTLLLALLLVAPAPAQQQSGTQGVIPLGVSNLYYEIGGGQAMYAAPASRVVTINLNASAALGFSCGKFNPRLAVQNFMNQVKNGVDQMQQAVVYAANAAIGALPAYVLQRANPGLYELLQRAIVEMREVIQIATKSCEEMEAQIAQGKNPYAEWITLSRGKDWQYQLGIGSDVVTAKDTVARNSGNSGVDWVGGDRGGQGQPPIDIVGDTVSAGYNALQGRSPTTTGLGGADNRLTQIWSSPDEAKTFAQQVLGEKSVRTCDGCRPQAKPGSGLSAQYERLAQTATDEVQALAAGTGTPTADQLGKASAAGVGVTLELVQALRALPANDRAIAVGKLGGELAVARTAERALLLRRTLLAGRQVPEIAAAGDAQNEIDRKVHELDRDLDNLLYEQRIRRELVSSTASSILQDYYERLGRGLQRPAGSTGGRIEGGGLRP